MKKVKFIYNAKSGENVIVEYLDEIIGIYQEKGYTLIPYKPSFSEDDDMAMLEDIDPSYHHILISGGDGSVNYVVNAMKRLGIDIPIAVLPTGTANDFASMLGVPSDIPRACRMILDGETVGIDLGKANDEYFVNVFSCGLFTEVSHKTPAILKNNFGKLAYYINGLGELPAFKMMHITVDADSAHYDGPSVIFFVFNGQTAGQLRLAHLSEIDDGLLDVIVIKGDNPLETLRTVLHFIRRNPKNYPSGVFHAKCEKLTVYSNNDEQTDIDGEPGPCFPVTITCESGALKVLRPSPTK